MAVQRYRRVRRPKEQPSLTAASMPFLQDRRDYKNPLSQTGTTAWQIEAWDLLDHVGELRYYVSWRSNSCSKIRLVASELDEEGKPTGKCDNQFVVDLVNSIGGNQLGAAEFLQRSVEHLTVPGVTYMGIIVENGRERWLAFSKDEVRKTGEHTTVEMPDGRDHKITGADWLWKCWKPHPRRGKEADSPVRANLDALREIVSTTRTIADVAKSRLLGAGIVFVPSEMSLPSTTAPGAADQPGAPIELQGVPAVRELEELLYDVARASYDDDESYARMIPVFASVPGEMVKNVHHLKFDSEFTDQAIKTRNDAIARLALGLDVSPERLLGLGSSTNHWSAWQIGDNDVQMHLAPVMELICNSLTENLLYRMLQNAGMSVTDMSQYLVWYDASELTADPDKSDGATDAFDRGVITAQAYREFLNLGATGYDLNTLEGWQQWARDQIANEPTLITNLSGLVPELAGVEIPELTQIEENIENQKQQVEIEKAQRSDTTNEGNDPDTKDNDPGENQGSRGRKEDVGSRIVTPYDAFLQAHVRRALEFAGKRRRNINDRSQKDRLRNFKPHEYHLLMGPVDEDRVPELIAGWDASLEDDVLRIFGVERGEFADRVRAEARRQLMAPVVTVDQ